MSGTLLVISPDYASHYLPLAAVAAAWRDRGGDVVVATGPTLASRVVADGYEHRELVLGAGANPGLLRPEDQRAGKDDRARAFLVATRGGLVATLGHQADARLHDLLWRPSDVADRLTRILDDVRPDRVLCDQIAFGATAVLRGLRQPYASLLPGHPCAIPGPGDLYGYPTVRPARIPADPAALRALWAQCLTVTTRFTATWNDVVAALDPGARRVRDAFAVHPPCTLVSYPAALLPPGRRRPGLTYLGACVRSPEPLDDELAAWLDAHGAPVVLVALGSFLSARDDVLERIVEGLASLPVRVLLVTGVNEPDRFGDLPPSWLARPFVPQVSVLPHAALVVCHGGNNTVTEALSAGVPLLVGPFSTDQFAGAADLERSGLGAVFDPNGSDPAEIGSLAAGLLAGPAVAAAARLGGRLRDAPGPRRAARLLGAATAHRGVAPTAGV